MAPDYEAIKAAAEGYGVGNFDVFNTELLKGVMEAAEEANAPVILAYGPPFEKYSPLKYFAPAVKAWAADTDLPVVLHYDHGTSLEGCVHAVECGCNSVLNPGTVVGRHSNIYPTTCVRGVVPENSIYKNNGEIVSKL